ncbi:nucleoside 2-deoxyribosyltransferase [Pelistega sp. NLN82]|uniref:Nucleoside 2-deoxyribosyltransferase n=1 Tax=Pelistega ratti TaxID=2652177 RepID=A0A6L9Y4S5_9BURK|nr:nucleoside 2-deoxyribosyltransferase [Pelistega ratti]NEN75246.1 nucleoside 2-deoxyribosyltransferase [Pelistega ratti]
MKTIYLAGFDVFRQDAVDHGLFLQQLCQQYGFKGNYPLDNTAPSHLTGQALAQWIYEANIQLIQQADIVIANVNPFRGFEPDSGTVFEIGYAKALGKTVCIYTEQQKDLRTQVPHKNGIDQQGFIVEDFGLNLNLMIACSVDYQAPTFEACLQYLAKQLLIGK